MLSLTKETASHPHTRLATTRATPAERSMSAKPWAARDQCRRFEVPTTAAASSFRNVKSKSGTGILCFGSGAPGRASRRSHQRGNHDAGENQPDDRVLERVVDVLVPRLHALAQQAQVVDVAENLVEHADALARFVLGRAFLDDVAAHP